MIKAVPGAGTIAGGILQGIVQAIVTRWIGNVFISYFKNEMCAPPGGMAAIALAVVKTYKALGGGWQIRCEGTAVSSDSIVVSNESSAEEDSIDAQPPLPQSDGVFVEE